MKTGEWIDLWMKAVRQTRAKNTVHSYSKMAVSFRDLRDIELEALSPSDVLRWNLSLALPPRSKEQAGVVLRACLSMAIKMRLITFNPTDPLTHAKRERKFKAVWSSQDARQFLMATDSGKYALLFRLALSTGLRMGELLGLKYEDFKSNGEVLIERQILEIKGSRTVSRPKTGSRKIRISPEERARVGEGTGFLFMTGVGTSLTRAQVYGAFKEALLKSGVPIIRFHDLRHMSASFLLSAGVPITVVSNRLGHARVSTTLDIYSHSLPSGQELAAEKMEEVLG